jgi:hypothetical protein
MDGRSYKWTLVTSRTELIKVTGRAHFSLLCGSKCGDAVRNEVSWSHNQQYDWAIGLQFNKCNQSWSVCSVCSLQRRALVGYSLRRHHTQKHAVNMINQSNIEDSNFVTSIETIEIPNVTDNCHETGVSLGEVGAINVTFGNANSNSFFTYDVENVIGGGATYLLKRNKKI